MGWDTLAWLMLASLVISVVMAPKVQNPSPTAFDEIDFPQTDEGTPQAVFFGDCWSDDWLVITVGNYRTEPIKAETGK